MDEQLKHTDNLTSYTIINSAPFSSTNNYPHNDKNNSQIMQLTQSTPLYVPQTQLKWTNNTMQINAILEISDQKYILYFNVQSNKQALGPNNETQNYPCILHIQYHVTQTIGTNGNTIIIFINSNKNVNQQNDQQQQQNPTDQLINLIRNQRKGDFFLRGKCTLIINFINNQTMQKAYNLLSLYVGEEDEGNSQYDHDQGMQEMISADNIDQFGNIIVKNNEDQNQDQQEGEQWEDEQQGENMVMQDQSEQKHN